MIVPTKHNKEFNGTDALRALGEWLLPFYSPIVLARPSLNFGVMCAMRDSA